MENSDLFINPDLQKLYWLLENYVDATSENREDKERKIMDLFRETSASFTSSDVSELKIFSTKLYEKQSLPELYNKVNDLVQTLSVYTGTEKKINELPLEIQYMILEHIGGLAGIFIANKQYAEILNEQTFQEYKKVFLAALNRFERGYFNNLEELIDTLKICGTCITSLDFSKLIRERIPNDNITNEQWEDYEFIRRNRQLPVLSGEKFKNILNLCPRLRSLTLYKGRSLKPEELLKALDECPARLTIKELNIVDCDYFDYRIVDRVQESFPEIIVNFLNHPSAYDLSSWVDMGLKLKDFFALVDGPMKNLFTGIPPTGNNIYYQRNPFYKLADIAKHLPKVRYETARLLCENRNQASTLARAGMDFLEYDALSRKSQGILLDKADQVAQHLRSGHTLSEFLDNLSPRGTKRSSDESSFSEERDRKKPRTDDQ